MTVPIFIAHGGVSFKGKATMQMGGGTPAITRSFFTDNVNTPGDYTTASFLPFSAVVTAMDGASPDTGYAGVVNVSFVAKPPGASDPTMFVDMVQDDPINAWVNGVSTQLIEWVMNELGPYTFQLDDGVTVSQVVVTVV